jgi:hypothetical protein
MSYRLAGVSDLPGSPVDITLCTHQCHHIAPVNFCSGCEGHFPTGTHKFPQKHPPGKLMLRQLRQGFAGQ